MLNFLQDTFIISAIQARDSGEGLYQQRSLVIIVALMHVRVHSHARHVRLQRQQLFPSRAAVKFQ